MDFYKKIVKSFLPPFWEETEGRRLLMDMTGIFEYFAVIWMGVTENYYILIPLNLTNSSCSVMLKRLLAVSFF